MIRSTSKVIKQLKPDTAAGSRLSGGAVSLIEELEGRAMLAAVKIMPLGDSITEGNTNSPTYRYYLWHQLQDAGYDVDFVGQYHGVLDRETFEHNVTPINPDFDQDHEGHSGEGSQFIAGMAYSFAAAADPDIVLLHIGTNDARGHIDLNYIVSQITLAIDELRRANPNVHIVLARIIPNGEVTQEVIDLNNAIPGIAASRDTENARVLVVDQYTGFSLETDFPDNDSVHPNAAGDGKMATRWFNALKTLLGPGAGGAPAAPTALKGTPNKTWVNVKWYDKSSNEDGFVIQRKKWSTGTFQDIGEVDANVVKFTDATSLVKGVKYYYRVQAINGTGTSEYTAQTVAVPVQTSLTVFASDLHWSRSTNSLGPAERDHSNGGSIEGDGGDIAIANATYSKGIGTFGDSSIQIELDGEFKRFTSDAGLDNNLANNDGSVTFKIYADGKKIYDSGIVGHVDTLKKIDLSVFGVDQLVLVVSSSGDGTDNDFANWGHAKLTR